MKRYAGIFTLVAAFVFFSLSHAEYSKTRVIIMADMGNEPDEEQQIMHMLMYANMFDLEGLIACSGKYLNSDRTGNKGRLHPHLLHNLVDGYAKVIGNLKLHASGWPTPEYLKSIIKSGTLDYGMAAVQPGKSNEASKLMEAAIVKKDPRKLYIVGNAGTNTLAQALVDLDQTRTQAEMDALSRKIIVFENGAQDNAGAWIANKYPDIAWHRSNHQTYAYGGSNGLGVAGPYTWEPYSRDTFGQHEWAAEHIMKGHGPLGALFPYRGGSKGNHFIEGGGTVPWIGLANHGLAHPEHLYWGGWSGRFSRTKHPNVYSRHNEIKSDESKYGGFKMFEADSEREKWTDPVHGETFDNSDVPVWRFRRAMFNDFRGRMDWCVKPFAQANHNPVAAFNGDKSDTIIRLKALPGQQLFLDASASTDPDNDELEFSWWIYREAGTYGKNIPLPNSKSVSTTLTIPDDALNSETHLILEVQDKSKIVPLTDYRRIVIEVVKELPTASVSEPGEFIASGSPVRFFMHEGLPLIQNQGNFTMEMQIKDLRGATRAELDLAPNRSHYLSLERGVYFLSAVNAPGQAKRITIH